MRVVVRLIVRGGGGSGGGSDGGSGVPSFLRLEPMGNGFYLLRGIFPVEVLTCRVAMRTV